MVGHSHSHSCESESGSESGRCGADSALTCGDNSSKQAGVRVISHPLDPWRNETRISLTHWRAVLDDAWRLAGWFLIEPKIFSFVCLKWRSYRERQNEIESTVRIRWGASGCSLCRGWCVGFEPATQARSAIPARAKYRVHAACPAGVAARRESGGTVTIRGANRVYDRRSGPLAEAYGQRDAARTFDGAAAG